MKLDKFAIIDALESGNNREAVQVLFHHFRLGEVPENLQIVRYDSPLMQMDYYYYNRCWYEWTARYGFRKGKLPGDELFPPLAKIRFPG
jgi:hypothetical protein